MTVEVPVLQNQKRKHYYSHVFAYVNHTYMCESWTYCNTICSFMSTNKSVLLQQSYWRKQTSFVCCVENPADGFYRVAVYFLLPKREKNGCSLCDTHLGGSVQPRLCISGASRKHNIYKIANLFQLKKMLHMHTHIISNHQYRQIFFF